MCIIEQAEEQAEAIDPPGGSIGRNNIGGDPPTGEDPPTGSNQPIIPTPPGTPPSQPNPPTADDYSKKPRQGKYLTLLKLIQDQSDQFIKPTKYLEAETRSNRYRDVLATLLAMTVDKKELNLFGTEYLLKNKQLASDILAVIEEEQFLLESYLKVDIRKLDSTDSLRLHSLEMDAAEDKE